MDAVALDKSKIVELDFTGDEFRDNAQKHMFDWATRDPFYIVGNGPTQVIVGRYADAGEVFRDPERFSSQVPRGKGYEQYDKFKGRQFLTQMDGEQHARLRRLIMPAFAPTRINQIEGAIASVFDEFLDEIAASGREFDAMAQYASRFVIGALLRTMLGLSPEQQKSLFEYQEVIPFMTTMKPGDEYPDHVELAWRRANQVVEDVISDRRSNPRSDFLTDLVTARDHDDRLNDIELSDMVFGIFAALATTPRSGGGALYMLYSHPDQIAQVAQNPSLVPQAIEECLRIAGNGYFTFARIATRDTEVGGTVIGKGMIVRPSPMSANYDPTVYTDPMRFDIHRQPQRIMTFGAGPHHCVGNVLGRRALCVALRQLVKRFPNARLADPVFRPKYTGAVGELRLTSLPMLTH